MTVSDNVAEEVITCSSCEYRYSAGGGICPMCGTEPLRPLLKPANRFSRARYDVRILSASGVWRLIPVVALIALMSVTWFFYKNRKGSPAKESRPAAELKAPSEQIKIENASQRIVPDPVGGVQHVIADTRLTLTSEKTKVENAAERQSVQPAPRRVQQIVAAKPAPKPAAKQVPAPTIDAAKADPAELWKAVKRGNVNAEVALANLYLQGEAVPQNCEQAHMLLSVASTKGSKAADNLLKSTYAERCQ
jgi:hypothetical protein